MTTTVAYTFVLTFVFQHLEYYRMFVFVQYLFQLLM